MREALRSFLLGTMKPNLTKLHDAQNGKCIWCGLYCFLPDVYTKTSIREILGIPLHQPGSSKVVRYRYATREHIIPKALGGRAFHLNTLVACEGCNNSRKSSLSWHFCEEVFEMIGRKKQKYINKRYIPTLNNGELNEHQA